MRAIVASDDIGHRLALCSNRQVPGLTAHVPDPRIQPSGAADIRCRVACPGRHLSGSSASFEADTRHSLSRMSSDPPVGLKALHAKIGNCSRMCGNCSMGMAPNFKSISPDYLNGYHDFADYAAFPCKLIGFFKISHCKIPGNRYFQSFF